MEINVISVIHINSFEKWLTTLGYAASTVYLSVRCVNDFFFYLKSHNITTLEAITPETITGYYKYLQSRQRKSRDNSQGGLSPNYIAGNINALKRFGRYLQATGRGNLEITLQPPVNKATSKLILSIADIRSMYKSCNSDYLGARDRAILDIYYGCGLRRTEGVTLDVKDVMLKEKLVFVRSGKGLRERYVPMTVSVRDSLEDYIYRWRESILDTGTNSGALLLNIHGKRVGGNLALERIHRLSASAGIIKPVGLHTLRHSIATHLLQSGLALEEVSLFLGHSSLESTQIYTHLANE